MIAVLAWLGAFWLAVWPNLAASVLWVPVTLAGNHLVLRWHLRRVHARLDRLHARPPAGETTVSGHHGPPPGLSAM